MTRHFLRVQRPYRRSKLVFIAVGVAAGIRNAIATNAKLEVYYPVVC